MPTFFNSIKKLACEYYAFVETNGRLKKTRAKKASLCSWIPILLRPKSLAPPTTISQTKRTGVTDDPPDYWSSKEDTSFKNFPLDKPRSIRTSNSNTESPASSRCFRQAKFFFPPRQPQRYKRAPAKKWCSPNWSLQPWPQNSTQKRFSRQSPTPISWPTKSCPIILLILIGHLPTCSDETCNLEPAHIAQCTPPVTWWDKLPVSITTDWEDQNISYQAVNLGKREDTRTTRN